MKTLSARFRPVLLSAVAGLYGLLPLPALAVDASLRADSYVSSSQPANNFGTMVGLTVRVGASQLDGPVSGTATGVASFNASFVALGTTCR
jgi:hypothetical protein